MPAADGIALENKLNNIGNIAISFCGDGATSEKGMSIITCGLGVHRAKELAETYRKEWIEI